MDRTYFKFVQIGSANNLLDALEWVFFAILGGQSIFACVLAVQLLCTPISSKQEPRFNIDRRLPP